MPSPAMAVTWDQGSLGGNGRGARTRGCPAFQPVGVSCCQQRTSPPAETTQGLLPLATTAVLPVEPPSTTGSDGPSLLSRPNGASRRKPSPQHATRVSANTAHTELLPALSDFAGPSLGTRTHLSDH